jgi:hypothetical protein
MILDDVQLDEQRAHDHKRHSGWGVVMTEKTNQAGGGEFSARPKGATPALGQDSAIPKGVQVDVQKSATPKAPETSGDQASTQPKTALPLTDKAPPPANKD